MAGMDGISYLIAVTQMKANNANDQALHGAEDQRKLVKKQEFLRQAQTQFESLVHDKKYDANDEAAVKRIYNSINEELGANSVNYGSRGVKGDGSMGDVSNDDQKANQSTVDSIRSELDSKMKSLEAEDRMGNFDIQRL